MNRHRELFERFRQGTLDENGIEELNQILLNCYFYSILEINPAELEYTEDLLIEFSIAGKLDENLKVKFNEALSANKSLLRKYNLLGDLHKSAETAKTRNANLLTEVESAESEKEEEEALSKILQEVIEKVHAEETSREAKTATDNPLSRMDEYLRSFTPAIIAGQPRYRLALVFASILIIAGIVWVSIRPEQKEPMAVHSTRDSILNDSTQKNDTVIFNQKQDEKPEIALVDSLPEKHYPVNQLAQQTRPDSKQDSILKALDSELLAYAGDIPTEIEYMQLRSESSAATDLYIKAADKFGNHDYDSCAIIFTGLLRSNAFTSGDTLNEINYYLGIIYMTKGFNKPRQNMLKAALNHFGKVGTGSPYYNDSKWYSALSEIRLGNRSKGKMILDSLIQNNYLRSGEVMKLNGKL